MERDPDVRQTCKKEARPAERLDSPSPRAVEYRARPQPGSLVPPQQRTSAASSPPALPVQAPCSPRALPANVVLQLAPCPGAASSRALPHARECVILAARASRARAAPTACRCLGKARGSLQRPTPTGWVASSFRAPFRSYKAFSPQTHVGRRCTGRHGGAGQAGRELGCRPGNVWSRAKGLAAHNADPTWAWLERGGSFCLVRDGISQGWGEGRHPNVFTQSLSVASTMVPV